MYLYSTISKVRKAFLAILPKAGLGLSLLLWDLTPTAALLVWVPHPTLLKHFTSGFFYTSSVRKCSTSFTTGVRLFLSTLPLTQDFASMCSQSAGKHQAGLRKMPLCVPDSPRAAQLTLVPQGIIKVYTFVPVLMTQGEDRSKLSEFISRCSLKFMNCFLVWAWGEKPDNCWHFFHLLNNHN